MKGMMCASCRKKLFRINERFYVCVYLHCEKNAQIKNAEMLVGEGVVQLLHHKLGEEAVENLLVSRWTTEGFDKWQSNYSDLIVGSDHCLYTTTRDGIDQK
ncbi:hypothetical protein [Thermoactinomyces sp. DSM 45892]|uniref:hypothetical protein n=1 Tax=Thermoactinomyces sp. DSM 45892 TaxID=1882753 RepID=UPI00089BFF82|nr:hypothetical protein [Thermoactinomyces sp. DSM 45892]SDY88207.1 hypothetical protein SAMN05444416_109158 [Thermoactinomyces sp. DSM 45892]